MHISVIDFSLPGASMYKFNFGTNMAVPIERRSFREFVN